MLEKVKVLLQDFIRTLDSPIQQIIYLRDIVEIAKKKDRLLQVLQTRISDEERGVFEKRIAERLAMYYPEGEFHVRSCSRDGIVYWCIGTGPHVAHSFEKLCEAVQDLGEHFADPQEISRDEVCDMEPA